MMSDDANATKDSREREKTDASLLSERAQADRALADRQSAVDQEADNVVTLARDTADAVLDAAREKADEHRGDAQQPSATIAAIAQERVVEDGLVHDQREAADASLRREREETVRTLRSLIPFERDETDRHLLTERALWDDAVANRDDFLGIVSHDLRGLLGGIVTAAALLALKAPDNPDGKHAVAQAERIQRYAARMNRLIGDLVDVASIETGKLSVAPTRADARALLSEAAETLDSAAVAKGIAIEVQVEPRPLQAVFDYPRLLQVMTNVVANAVKFTPMGGRIVVRGERVDGELRLSVSDTGPGIPSHQLEAVFERFWQVETGDQRGLGLGLYISRCLVEAHGGRIWAACPALAGTTIHVTLPDQI